MESTTKTFKKGEMVQSLQVGMSILDIISKEKRPLKYSEILELSGMTKSNLYKYLNTLSALDMVHRDPFSGSYSIGPKIIEYGMTAVNERDIADMVSPYMEEITRQWNETVLLSTITPQGPMIIKMINSDRPFNIRARIGTMLPLDSAGGKVFGAFKSEFSDIWKKEELKKLDSDRADELTNELKTVAENKIAFGTEVMVPSNASMSVPIFNHENSVIAALIMIGYKKDISHDISSDMCQYFINKGKEISRVFGG